MADSDKLAKLTVYHALVKQTLTIADKERRHGQVPMEETLASLHAEHPTDEQIADLPELAHIEECTERMEATSSL